MTTTISLREARARLGELAEAAHHGETIVLTKHGRPYARLAPLEGTVPETTTYTAAIGTASDVVTGDYCDVSVAENEIVGYRDDEDGNEVPVYGMSNNAAMDPINTDVPTADEDAADKAIAAATEILEANGWRVTEGWDISDNALYATVERA